MDTITKIQNKLLSEKSSYKEIERKIDFFNLNSEVIYQTKWKPGLNYCMGKPDRQRSLRVTIDRPEKATAPVCSVLTEKPSSHSYTHLRHLTDTLSALLYKRPALRSSTGSQVETDMGLFSL